MVVMPADHVIEPVEAFRKSIRAAVYVIDDDPTVLVTFGITPTRPETGYGYIERGPLLERREEIPVFRVIQFREKPDRATAETFLESGRFLWNSGIFIWRARTILDELQAHRPRLAEGLQPILKAMGTPDEPEALVRLFPQLERVPIDKAVMEHARNVRVLEVPYNWSDVGDWRAPWPPCWSTTTRATPSRATSWSATQPTRSSSRTTAASWRPSASTTSSSSTRARRRWSPGKTSSTSSKPWSKDWPRPAMARISERRQASHGERNRLAAFLCPPACAARLW